MAESSRQQSKAGSVKRVGFGTTRDDYNRREPGGGTYYELNENLEIERWDRLAAQALGNGVMRPPLEVEERDLAAELRAKWTERPETDEDKVPDEFLAAENYLLLDRARRAAYLSLRKPSDLPWPQRLPSREYLLRIAHRRLRPMPRNEAARARERGRAMEPELMFWDGTRRRMTLGRDFTEARNFTQSIATMQAHIIQG